ncbi:MAG: universal stress protein [Deltaproteobacteria bacterium]|nr:universal stress protein [Deltaproteobacteria bacterium]
MQIDKIIVAIDFSRHSEAAVSQALKVARGIGAELILLHVGLMPDQIQFDDSVAPTAVTEYQRLAKAHLDVDREKLSQLHDRISGQGVTVSKLFRDGHPDEAIIEAAADTGAKMIVVGTHGRTGFRRLALGSVAQRVVRTASVPVLVARPDPEPRQRFNHIFVATDFSSFGKAATALAFELAEAGSTVELFSSWQMPAEAMGFHPPVAAEGALLGPIIESMEKSARARLQDIVDGNAKEGVNTTIRTVEGNPSRCILRALETGDYDLVVTGSHGRRGFRRWLLGSVSERIVQLAPCSVLVVREPSH